ncbi:MAG: isochorismatase family protein [Deltaproteobacteria bacterium]|nr:isochorismatase family protein [Deltaproteobacteria bacterium]
MERLLSASTTLLIVDVQEKLAAAMPADALERLVKNTTILLEAAKTLGVNVIATEQYPKGLGPTIAPLATKLAEVGAAVLPKMTFDACSDLAISRALTATGARAVVVVGMETHVCVFQTARELVKRGVATHVVADAVASRREENRQLGLSLCERAGAIAVPTETVVFDLLEVAGTEAFKAVSKLVR